MKLFIPVIIPWIVGFGFAAMFLKNIQIPAKKFLMGVLSLPLGLGLCTLTMFWAYFLFPDHAKSMTWFLSLVLAAFAFYCLIQEWTQNSGWKPIASSRHGMFFRMSPKPPFLSASIRHLAAAFTFILLVFVLYQYALYFIGKESWNILGGWDARYFWNLKAKFFFRDPAQWKGMFSSAIPWTHPDYPLLLPASIAWGWNLLGAEYLAWPAVLDFAFFMSLLALVIWFVGVRAGWPSGFLAGALLATVPVYRFWATTQYADIPLAFFFTASSALIVFSFEGKHVRLFTLAGLIAGLSAWMKNEGLFFAGWGFLMVFFTSLCIRNVSASFRMQTILFFSLGALLPLLTVFYAKLVLGLEGGEYWGSGRSIGDYWSALTGNFEKTKFIAVCFFVFKGSFTQWSILWYLFAATLILFFYRIWHHYRWVLPGMVLLIEWGYFLVLHVAPSEISFQISVSLHRLLLHSGAIALMCSFDLLGPMPLAGWYRQPPELSLKQQDRKNAHTNPEA